MASLRLGWTSPFVLFLQAGRVYMVAQSLDESRICRSCCSTESHSSWQPQLSWSCDLDVDSFGVLSELGRKKELEMVVTLYNVRLANHTSRLERIHVSWCHSLCEVLSYDGPRLGIRGVASDSSSASSLVKSSMVNRCMADHSTSWVHSMLGSGTISPETDSSKTNTSFSLRRKTFVFQISMSK